MQVLVVVELASGQPTRTSLSAIGFAQQMIEVDEGELVLLVLGHMLQDAASETANFGRVLSADDPSLEHPLASRYAPVIAAAAKQLSADLVVAGSSTWSKDIVTRAAGLLGGSMASDVVAHEWVDGQLRLVRPMYAGAVNAKVALHGHPQIITVRPSAYPPVTAQDQPFEISQFNVEPDSSGRCRYGQLSGKEDKRPDVTDAQIVVSGGRAFKNSEDFERLVGGLADQMHAATGSSRALVDAGITPNSYQVGQTGKVVAPDLYLALGLSGAVQHLAGMKNSKIIAAVNTDREAPIFEIADYGLVGDVYEIVPQLIELLRDKTRQPQ